MVYIILVAFAVYFMLMIFLVAGWQKGLHAETKPKDAEGRVKNFISVIIPFRNEASILGNLIDSLSIQTYDQVEFLLVDDHSTDNGPELARNLITDKPAFRLIRSEGQGKKRAITQGINAALGQIIVTTDADCTFLPDWLAIINGYFKSVDVKLVFGSVHLTDGATLFSQLQQIEFLSVIGTGISFFNHGFPLYCNGANLAYRKEVFHEVKGYHGNLEIPSGDDEFLFKKVSAAYPRGVVWMSDPGSTVTTLSQTTPSSFFHQRLRWAGKWKHSNGFVSKLAAFTLFAIQVAMLGALAMIFSADKGSTVAMLFLGKVALDFVFLFNVGQYFSYRVKLLPFILLQFIYPFYVIGIALSSNFLSFEWKGRLLRSRESTTGHF